MNFKKLQAMQAKLDEAILAEKAPMTQEERFNKTLVALSVEIAEVANCAEHFKFWKDNKGKVDSERFRKFDYGDNLIVYEDWGYGAKEATVDFAQAHKLTLIEECSDALHFILSLANQYEFEMSVNLDTIAGKYDLKDYYYIDLQKAVFDKANIDVVLYIFLNYTKSLNITPQEIEQAYYDKNKINYERLENGY